MEAHWLQEQQAISIDPELMQLYDLDYVHKAQSIEGTVSNYDQLWNTTIYLAIEQ